MSASDAGEASRKERGRMTDRLTELEDRTEECPTCGQQASVLGMMYREAELQWRLEDDRRFAAMIDRADDNRWVRHLERFRRVSNSYPHRVAEAYEGDLARAATESDERVAATVASWEQAQGIGPGDWQAIGAEERDETKVEELER